MKLSISAFLSFFLLFNLWSPSVLAQCEDELEGKQEKLLAKAQDRKKYEPAERVRFLQDALEEGDGCISCQFMLGELQYKRAKSQPGLSFSSAQTQLAAVAERCPEFHADVHYYLGVIHYAQEEWTDALEAFDRFMDFPLDDDSKLSRSHQRKMGDVADIIGEIEFNAEFFDKPVPFDPQRIELVSSSADEYLPMISPDNALLYYTRKSIKKAKGDLFGRQVEEFTRSQRASVEASFDAGTALAPPFNQGDNYGGATMSLDNREMFITVCRPDASGYNNCDIYTCRWEKASDASGKEEYRWTELENLGAAVNSRQGWESQPSLSADGQTLYFATVREGTMPNPQGDPSTDLYMSLRGPDGVWGRAIPLPGAINTPGNDKSPFMHGDSRTLYFASDGRPGAGGYDIFYTRMQDSGEWSEPRNIGIPINTPEDEHGLIVSTDGHWAYYASSKLSGSRGFDLYRFALPESAKPEKVVLVRGQVEQADGSPASEARVQLNYVESKRVEEVEVDSRDGSYAAMVNVEKEPAVLTVEAEDQAFQALLITEADAEKTVKEMDVDLQKEELGKPYTINDIYYSTSSAEIDEDSKAVLQVFAQYLQSRPSLKVAIHGHTDNVGGELENLTLSTERAFEVMRYLQELGVSSKKLSYEGFGPKRPIESNATAEGRARNRRTEFIITAR